MLLVSGAMAEGEEAPVAPVVNLEMDHGIAVVKADQFIDVVHSGQKVLMMFYAPWCGHCASLQFPYIQVAGLLLQEKTGITVAKFDATGDDIDTKMVKHLYKVKSFPAIFMFNDGGHMRLDSSSGFAQDEAGIVKFAKSFAEPRWKEITTEEEMVAIETNDKLFCMGYFFHEFRGPQANAMRSAAFAVKSDNDNAAKFYLTRDKDLFTRSGRTDPGIMCVSQENGSYQAKTLKLGMTDDYQVILQTAHHFALPPVLTLNLEEAIHIGHSPRKHHLIAFVKEGDAEMQEKVTKLLETVEAQFPLDIVFVVAPISDFGSSSIQSNFGLTDFQDLPAIGFVNKTKVYKPGIYKFEDESEMTSEKVAAFVGTYMEHNAPQYILSERLVPFDASLLVNKLVAKNFDDVVFDEDVDVVVMFHNEDTPMWMFKEFEAIADVFKSIDSVRFGTFNTKRNKISQKFRDVAFPLANGLRSTKYLPAVALFSGLVEPEEGEEATTEIKVEHCEDQMEKAIIINFLKPLLQTVEIEA